MTPTSIKATTATDRALAARVMSSAIVGRSLFDGQVIKRIANKTSRVRGVLRPILKTDGDQDCWLLERTAHVSVKYPIYDTVRLDATIADL